MYLLRAGIFVLFNHFVQCSLLYDWLGWADKKDPNLTCNGVPLLKVPYEELAPEDKFLVEASKIAGLELSDLDVCQHKLVMKLKSSCGSLSEEELAKFSVNLLNCQASVEGRTQYPCEENMSLKKCTENMDPETWNTYHIMNNRARAVCYATRQIQFRTLSELTINRLMLTTHTHLEALNSLQVNNEKLKSSSLLTIQELEKGQEKVLAKQRSLVSLSISLGNHQENALNLTKLQGDVIKSYSNALNLLLQNLSNYLEINIEKSREASNESSQFLHSVMKQLDTLTESISKMFNTVEDGHLRLEKSEQLASGKLNEALLAVKEINQTIMKLTSLFNTLKSHSTFIAGEEGERLEMILVVGPHVLYLTAAMAVFSFLSAPGILRFLLISGALANLYATFSSNPSIPNVPMHLFYLTFFIIVLGDWLVRLILVQYRRKKLKTVAQATVKEGEIHQNYTHLTTPNNRVNKWLSDSQRMNGLRHANGYLRKSLHETYEPLVTPLIEDNRSVASSVRRSSRRTTPARSTESERFTCLAISKSSGNRCKNFAVPSSHYCKIHSR